MTYKEFIQNIIDTRGQWALEDDYWEGHHIIPVCKNGEGNSRSKHPNIIRLTEEEHRTAHRLLAEENPSDYQLVNVYNAMCSLNGKFASEEDLYHSREMMSIINSERMKINNPMFDENIKRHHDDICATDQFRLNVSNGMKKMRSEVPFSKEHLKHIRESTDKHRDENHAKGLTLYGTPLRKDGECGILQQFVHNNRAVYCIFNNERHDFKSIREASIWWHSVSPLTKHYVECTLQRKIRDSANNLQIKYKGTIIDNIKWYWKEGDINE